MSSPSYSGLRVMDRRAFLSIHREFGVLLEGERLRLHFGAVDWEAVADGYADALGRAIDAGRRSPGS